MKKLVMFGIAIMMAFMLTGSELFLSNTSDTSSDTEGSDKEEITQNELTVWCWDETFNVYAMKEAALRYQKKNPKVRINVVTASWGEVQESLTIADASKDYGTLPDIVLIQDNAFQKNIIRYSDIFQDLTDTGIDFSQFAAGKTAYSVVDGKNYGVPFDNGAVVACYRTDILQEAGYTISDLTDITWNRFLEIGEDVLEKTGYSLVSTEAGEPELIMMMLQSAGASLFDADGNPTIADNDVLKEVIKVYVEMAKKGVLQVTDDNWEEYINSFQAGSTAGVINGCWIIGSIESVEDQNGNWGITNMPKLEGVKSATNYSNNGGSSWAITANCQNFALASDFLNQTFAQSVEFYADILSDTGAIATWIPAAKADVYDEGIEFFGGDKVFAKVIDYSNKVPVNNTGAYYYEARDAVSVAVMNIMNGADEKRELQTAQDTAQSYKRQ